MDNGLVDGGITSTKVILAPIKEIISYQIIEQELKKLEEGFDGGIFLNICIAFASSSISLLVTVFTCDFGPASVTKAVLLTSALFCLLIAIVLGFIHSRFKKQAETLFSDIRDRKNNITLPSLNNFIDNN